MITGKLMFDVEIEAENQGEIDDLTSQINKAVRSLHGVTGSEKVDEDLNDDSDE